VPRYNARTHAVFHDRELGTVNWRFHPRSKHHFRRTYVFIFKALDKYANDLTCLSYALFAVADAIHMAIIYIVIVLTTMSLISVQIPYMALPCFLLICASISLQAYYAKKVKACRAEFQKTNDEVFINLSDCLEGSKIIRTADQISWSFDMLRESFIKTRVSTLVNEQCVVWLMRRADALGVALSFTTCILSVTLDLPPSSRGLVLSSSLQVLVFYSWFMRNLASAIYCSGCVDRVYSYVHSIPREERAGKSIDKSWPKSGNVQVLMLRHYPILLR
jgi:ATP-binding cassette subfamily C (CFTR/MRP) protein 1